MTFNLIFSIKNQYTVEESTIFLDFDSSIYHNHAFVVVFYKLIEVSNVCPSNCQILEGKSALLLQRFMQSCTFLFYIKIILGSSLQFLNNFHYLLAHSKGSILEKKRPKRKLPINIQVGVHVRQFGLSLLSRSKKGHIFQVDGVYFLKEKKKNNKKQSKQALHKLRVFVSEKYTFYTLP